MLKCLKLSAVSNQNKVLFSLVKTVPFFSTHGNSPRPRLRGVKGRFASSGSSSEDEAAAAGPALSLSPPSLLSLPSFKDVGNEKGGEKEVWVSVFRHLTRAQLLTCMSVCKAWYKWCVSALRVGACVLDLSFQHLI